MFHSGIKRGVGWSVIVVSLGLFAGAKSVTKERISYRTVKPIAGHFQTEQEASATEKTLKQIGCATQAAQHNGHIDVTYECRFWRTLTLDDSQEVSKWNDWLTAKGFAVVHNTPSADHPEAVKYRLPGWRTLHFDKSLDAKAHLEMFKMLGCEVSLAKHNGHQDVKFRCPSWQMIGVRNHQQAHAWIQLLKKLGFATSHEH